MDRFLAEALVRSLLGRLRSAGDAHELPSGILSGDEVTALTVLIDAAPSPQKSPPGNVGGGPAVVRRHPKLQLDCLEAQPDEDDLVCLDFGTAFSKAAAWSGGDEHPVPLELTRTSEGRLDYAIQSAVYISDGLIRFGSEAVAEHAKANDPSRRVFGSPKEYLTHDIDQLEAKVERDTDPTGTFRRRDLLTLYLGYMTAATGEALERGGIARYTRRRFAVPGWSNSQVERTSAKVQQLSVELSDLFVNAQILADSVSPEEWLEGVPVDVAAHLVREVSSLLATDREKASFVERPVLEAVAAATGVTEVLANRRPQLLVVDVGAGTIDVGVFKLATPKKGAAVISPYASGMAAIRKAGNHVDNLLLKSLCRRLNLHEGTQHFDLYRSRLQRQIRDHKDVLFSTGSVTVDLEEFDLCQYDLPDFLNENAVIAFADQFRQAIITTLNGAGVGSANFIETRDDNVVVFTGGGGGLPFLRAVFDSPLELEAGSAHFNIVEARPTWLREFDDRARQLFPQLAVATGGVAPTVPDERSVVQDTRYRGATTLGPMYR